MPKSPEFDFSKLEDRKQFEALPDQAKEILSGAAHTEAIEIDKQKKDEEKIEKNKQFVTAENMKLEEDCKDELPLFRKKYEELLKEQISKAGNKEEAAIAYEELGDKSKALELRKEIFTDLFNKITQDKKKEREKATKSLNNLNSLVLIDGLVHNPLHGITFKPEIFSVEMVNKGKRDLGKQIDENAFIGEQDDYLRLLREVKKIELESLGKFEVDNLETAKKDLGILALTSKSELSKANIYEQLGDTPKSLKALDEACKQNLSDKDKEDIADAYERLGAKSKAVEMYKKLIDVLFKATKDDSGGGGMFGGRMAHKNKFNEIGRLYKKIGDNDEAREMFQKYIDVYDKRGWNTAREVIKPSVAFHIGRTYGSSPEQRLNDLSSAYEELALLDYPQNARSYWKKIIEQELPLEKSICVYKRIIENNQKIIDGDFSRGKTQYINLEKVKENKEEAAEETERKELLKDERVLKKLKEWGHNPEGAGSVIEFAKEMVDQEEEE